MIEQPVLQALSGKAAQPAKGEAVPAKGETTASPLDFAAIMLAQQDLEGELLGAPDVAETAEAVITTAGGGNAMPESGKALPDEPPPENEATEKAPSPTGLAALANLPEMPDYRDIPILSPEAGLRLFTSAKAMPPAFVIRSDDKPVAPARETAALPVMATGPASPASHVSTTVPASPAAQANPVPPTSPATAPTEPAPGEAPAQSPSPSLRASDLQMVIAKDGAFSATLEKRAQSATKTELPAGEKAAIPPAPATQSLLSMYGKKPEKADKPAPVTALSQPAPAGVTGTLAPPAPASALPAPAPAPASAPQTAAPAPSTQPAQPSPQSIETLIERLVQARDTAQGNSARLSVTNSDFGTVSLRFDNAASGLSVSMTNADPEFASTARTALAERGVAAGDIIRADAGQTRAEQSFPAHHQPHSQSQAQAQAQTQGNGSGQHERFQPQANAQTPLAERDAHKSTEQGESATRPADNGLYI